MAELTVEQWRLVERTNKILSEQGKLAGHVISTEELTAAANQALEEIEAEAREAERLTADG